MPRGYVAGPYRAKTEWELVNNIRIAEYWAAVGWAYGCAMMCPHKNTAHFGGILGIEDDVWLEGDIEWLDVSDFAFIIPGWERSSGTIGEIKWCEKMLIPYFYMPQDTMKFENWLEEWRRNEAT